jgi:hypothetical protein
MVNFYSANIPVEYQLNVEGGSSPFLSPNSQEEIVLDQKNGTHFIPSAPSRPPVIPGETLLDYVPPHPPLSNPRKNHRYLFTLLENQDIGTPMDTTGLKDLILSIKDQIKNSSASILENESQIR